MRRISSFKEMIEAVQKNPQKKTLAIIAAEEPNIVSAVVRTVEEKIIKDAIFVGRTEVTQQIIARRVLSLRGVTMINEPDKVNATQEAIKLIISGEAQMLMKGAIPSNIVMSGVLNNPVLKERRGKNSRASHIVVVEKEEHFEIWSDCGLNPTGRGELKETGWFISAKTTSQLISSPFGFLDVMKLAEPIDKGWVISEEKEVKMLRGIIKNAIEAAHLLGIEKPKVALISESNRINPKSSTSAIPKKLTEMDWPGAVVFMMDIDSARSCTAREMKGLSCPFEGEADIIVPPTLVAANMIKIGLFEWVWGGFLYNAGVPCPFPSEADDEESKYLSIVLAAYFDMMEERK